MTQKKLSMQEELHELQRVSFDYFIHETNPENGLVCDKSETNWPASIAATGLALAAYPIAVERRFMSRADALKRTLATLRFFWNSTQSTDADATGYKGFYYHFLDMQTGKRAWQCELSTIDTTFLIAGMLTVGVFFNKDTPDEREVVRLADALYRRVDWQWAQNEAHQITLSWKPESGFEACTWQGYDEAMLLYILGLGSPTHPLPVESYTAWTKHYKWQKAYGYEYLHSASLFTHQLSHIWIDFDGIQDAFMREKGSDYFQNSRIATYVQREYAIHNPKKFTGYNAVCWGITASDGPGPDTRDVNGTTYQFYDYIARGIDNGFDDGTIAPWVVVASLPFAPKIVWPVIDNCIHKLKLKENNPYGFKATFNQTYTIQSAENFWVSPWHYGINQGPIILMVENFRTRFLWTLMRRCPYLINGLKRAGFTGGYLS